MEQYGDMMAGAGIVVYIVLALFLALIAWGTYKIFKRSKTKPDIDQTQETYEEISEQLAVDGIGDGDVKIGLGGLQCICFRYIDGFPAADYTRLTKMVGELYQFDPSAHYSGNKYIVKQDAISIVDHDPREVPHNLEYSPQKAYLAISSDPITKKFWESQIKWWKSPSTIFAIIMLVILFVATLVVLG